MVPWFSRCIEKVREYRCRLGVSRNGITWAPPNYLFRSFETYDNHSPVVIDVGCGSVAELSRYMVKNYGAKCYAVDPTRKHAQALLEIAKASDSHIVYLPLAVSAQSGRMRFNESASNESGSLLAGHRNVLQDEIQSYEVEAVCLKELAARVGCSTIDLLKLDLEGAEYAILEQPTLEVLAPFKQIFVEFHDHCLVEKTREDTLACVRRMAGLGFRNFTLNDRDYLFYR